jgi:hypothetical protein
MRFMSILLFCLCEAEDIGFTSACQILVRISRPSGFSVIMPLCREAGRQGVPKGAGLVGGFHGDDFKQKALP